VELHPDIARALAEFKGAQLRLTGLREMSYVVAGELAKYIGRLDLYGISTLTDSAAEQLSKHQGTLQIRGLEELSDQAAQSLCSHKGELIVVLGRLPPSAAAMLRNAGLGIQ